MATMNVIDYLTFRSMAIYHPSVRFDDFHLTQAEMRAMAIYRRTNKTEGSTWREYNGSRMKIRVYPNNEKKLRGFFGFNGRLPRHIGVNNKY